MQEEKWFDCHGFENYEVSNLGRVRSKDRVDSMGRVKKGVVRKLKLKKTGYLHINLAGTSIVKTVAVHRLIASSIISPPPFDGAQVNHKDGNKQNNNIENLEWVTSKENTIHARATGLAVNPKGIDSKLTQYRTIATNIKTGDEFELIGKRMMQEFGFNQSCISDCARGKQVSHMGYTFKYLDLNGNEVERDTSGVKTQRWLVTAKNVITGEEIKMFGSKDYIRHGFTPCSVSNCIAGRTKTHKGYTFTREAIK